MHRHFILHKPYGYLSQFINNQNKRKNKRLLGELGDFPIETMAIGRLDENSEGLILLTTDGKVSELVRSQKVEKEYWVQVDGIITKEAIQQLRSGVKISTRSKQYQTLPAQVDFLEKDPMIPISPKMKVRDARHGPTSWITITICEGKFRQVRKMTAVVGFPTLRLVRVRIGNTHLHPIQAGQSKEVTSFNL
jgi:23S rRNA pseudouridine2457 synthase